MNINQLQRNLKCTFQNEHVLEQAMTHRSYCNEHGLPMYNSYERLELMGDAVLQYIVTDHLMTAHLGWDEGQLTRKRAALVCEDHLSRVAKILNLDQFALLGHGEELSGGRQRKALLCDLLEAVIGAIHEDLGLVAAEEFIVRTVMAREELIFIHDSKTDLQEMLGANYDKLEYRLESESGQDHDKTFEVAVLYNGAEVGRGIGSSKQRAEQMAAAIALVVLS